MLWYQIVLLALVQGLTEFLPISSSAHLILPSQVLDWPDQGLAFDLAVHVGTLFAVLIYLRGDIINMIQACLAAVLGKGVSQDAKLAMMIVIGTIPAVFIGLLVKDFVEQSLRNILVIAVASIGFGLLLLLVEKKASLAKELDRLNISHSLLIGLAQALAFIPGTSRSGITITAALALGFNRRSALRFSFLLSIPLILAGGLLSGLDLYESGADGARWVQVAVATGVAGLSAYVCIHFFITLVDRIGMLPFVIYRVVLGFVLLSVYFLFLSA